MEMEKLANGMLKICIGTVTTMATTIVKTNPIQIVQMLVMSLHGIVHMTLEATNPLETPLETPTMQMELCLQLQVYRT